MFSSTKKNMTVIACSHVLCWGQTRGVFHNNVFPKSAHITYATHDPRGIPINKSLRGHVRCFTLGWTGWLRKIFWRSFMFFEDFMYVHIRVIRRLGFKLKGAPWTLIQVFLSFDEFGSHKLKPPVVTGNFCIGAWFLVGEGGLLMFLVHTIVDMMEGFHWLPFLPSAGQSW